MILLAYLIAWFQANFLLGVALSFAMLMLWGVMASEKRPAWVRRVALIPGALTIPFLLNLTLFTTDKLGMTHQSRGRIVAAQGRDATVEVGKMTHSSRSRKGRAAMYYDVTLRLPDGRTQSYNVNLLGVLRTDKDWHLGAKVLTVKYLPGVEKGWVVTGGR